LTARFSQVCLNEVDGKLQLEFPPDTKFKPFYIDFLSGKNLSRQKGSKPYQQLIAKACAVSAKNKPSILDVTAGLGQDAFALASLGADVLMLERSPILFALLDDALKRLRDVIFDFPLMLLHEDAISFFAKNNFTKKPDVIYCDPMFPASNKTALVKKEMQVLRDMIGDDHDADELFLNACDVAKKRVVVKRHRHAPLIAERKPDIVYKGRVCRYDVYLT